MAETKSMAVFAIHPSGKVSEHEVMKENWLKVMQNLVGGLVQEIPVIQKVPGAVVWANEEGLLMALRLNEAASVLTSTRLLGVVVLEPRTAKDVEKVRKIAEGMNLRADAARKTAGAV